MKPQEFSLIRHYLGSTQAKLARALCVSPKTIQAYEDGRRKITANAEKQLYFILAMQKVNKQNLGDCWDIKKCPDEWKLNCSAWQFHAGQYCWFLNGTNCKGNCVRSWDEKISICRRCEVFKNFIPSLIGSD